VGQSTIKTSDQTRARIRRPNTSITSRNNSAACAICCGPACLIFFERRPYFFSTQAEIT
jgi:hypothetical protein